MATINTALRYLRGETGEPGNLTDLTVEFLRGDNAAFLARVATDLKALAKKAGPAGTRFAADGVGTIGLIGEYGLIGYGIRRGQEILRVDHTPSHWSHAFLFSSPLSAEPKVNRSPKSSPWLWESTLEPATAFNRFTDRNGVGPRRFADYSRASFDLFAAHSVPNIAVIALALTDDERGKIMDRADDPDVDQLHYDISGLLGAWYSYLTDQASHPNPLARRTGGLLLGLRPARLRRGRHRSLPGRPPAEHGSGASLAGHQVPPEGVSGAGQGRPARPETDGRLVLRPGCSLRRGAGAESGREGAPPPANAQRGAEGVRRLNLGRKRRLS